MSMSDSATSHYRFLMIVPRKEALFLSLVLRSPKPNRAEDLERSICENWSADSDHGIYVPIHEVLTHGTEELERDKKNTDPVLSGQKQYGCQKPAHGD